MKRLSMILLGVLTLPAYGEIASVRGTDSKIAELSKTIESKADKSGYTPNMLLQTDTDGKLTATTLKTDMIENGAITNSKLATNIGMDKLDMGTLPTSGKHILIWNSATNKYVFEELMGKPTLQCDTEGEGCGISKSGFLRCDKWPEYDIGFNQCVDTSINGGPSYGYYGHDGENKNNETDYNLSAGEWAVKFSYGIIKGIASCNSTPGDDAHFTYSNDSSNWSRPGDTFNQSSEGQYCWCKMTEPAVSLWVFNGAHSSSSDCAYDCAYYCTALVLDYSEFRSALFSVVGK